MRESWEGRKKGARGKAEQRRRKEAGEGKEKRRKERRVLSGHLGDALGNA